MAKLKSELEVTCPCCQTILVVDTNLGRVVSHKEPDRGNKPELSDAQRILADDITREIGYGAEHCIDPLRADALAPTDEPIIGFDADKHPARADTERLNAANFHSLWNR